MNWHALHSLVSVSSLKRWMLKFFCSYITDIQLFILKNNPLVPYWKPHVRGWCVKDWATLCPLIHVIYSISTVVMTNTVFGKAFWKTQYEEGINGRREHWYLMAHISLLAWECLRIPQEELTSIDEEKDVWVTFFSLMPPRPVPGERQTMDGWIHLMGIPYVQENEQTFSRTKDK